VRLILASASPRRAELLRSAGYDFDIHAVEIDERIRTGESAVEYVERLATEKSARAMAELSGPAEAGHYVLIGADTAVVVDGEILGKPRDEEDARRMLRLLSGRTHQVMTGVSLRTAHRTLSRVEISNVWVVTLTEEQVEWYVGSGEGRDKAGGYAIQGLASRFIPRIEGSYSNVVGLPIAVVSDLIDRLTKPRSVLASGE